ncbi:MAG: heavy-metal-associated domain-containing protein [Flavobacteriaceae bacterium]|nr:heavy-metal-associated domain-containing protein [Flavobacteriaceae bacterium]
MKIINKILFVVVLSIFFISCGNDKTEAEKNEAVAEKVLVENLKNVEVQIKGMTCEIGCARLIQSKLYKANGVKFAKVSFADSIGNITYDANKISEIEIKDVIQKVAGGDLYKVVGMAEVENFKELNSQQ